MSFYRLRHPIRHRLIPPGATGSEGVENALSRTPMKPFMIVAPMSGGRVPFAQFITDDDFTWRSLAQIKLRE
ncbi:MAG: hypothetical protein ABSC41_10875 [Acidimicrobiales bacterium]|jgi:hypothetical protein